MTKSSRSEADSDRDVSERTSSGSRSRQPRRRKRVASAAHTNETPTPPQQASEHSESVSVSMINEATVVQGTDETPGESPANLPVADISIGDVRGMALNSGEMAQIFEQFDSVRQHLDRLLDEKDASNSDRNSATEDSGLIAAVNDQLLSMKQQIDSSLQSTTRQIKESQTAAATSQSDVLRTLTEAIFHTSGSTGLDDVRMRELLDGLEDRLTARLTLLLENTSMAAVSPPSSTAAVGSSASRTQPHQKAGMQTKAAATKQATPAPPVSREKSWAEIRQAFLTNDDIDTANLPTQEIFASDESAEAPADHAFVEAFYDGFSSDGTEVAECDTAEFCLAAQEAIQAIPQSADLSKMSREDLIDALDAREKVIMAMAGRLRRLHYSTSQTLSPEQLRGLATTCPEQLWTRVTATLERLDEQLRVGELEMSLERARIARQLVQLQESRSRIESTARQLGMDLKDDGSLTENPNGGNRQSSSRRWLGKLGFNH